VKVSITLRIGEDIGLVRQRFEQLIASKYLKLSVPDSTEDKTANGMDIESLKKELLLFKIEKGLNNADMDKMLQLLREVKRSSSIKEESIPKCFKSIQKSHLSSKNINVVEKKLHIKVLKQEYEPKLFLLQSRVIIQETLMKILQELERPEDYFEDLYDAHTFGLPRSGQWFHETNLDIKKRFGRKSVLLGLVLYTDATAVGFFGKFSLKPIYVAFANCCAGNFRSTIQALGFFPELDGTFSKSKEIKESKEAKHQLVNLTWEAVLENLDLDKPLHVEGFEVHMRIAFISGDNPEQNKTSFAKDSNTTLYPCRVCFVSK